VWRELRRLAPDPDYPLLSEVIRKPVNGRSSTLGRGELMAKMSHVHVPRRLPVVLGPRPTGSSCV